MSKTICEAIKMIVQDSFPGSRLVLFGSRARGEGDEKSDYDLLVVSPITLTPKQKLEWHSRLNRAIVGAVCVPVDLLIDSEEEIRQKLELPGHIIRSVMKDGVSL